MCVCVCICGEREECVGVCSADMRFVSILVCVCVCVCVWDRPLKGVYRLEGDVGCGVVGTNYVPTTTCGNGGHLCDL